MGDAPSECGVGDEPISSDEIIQTFAPHPYQSLDADGRILRVNEAWTEVLGYDRDDVEGAHFSEFLTQGSEVMFEDRFPELQSTGSILGQEFEMVSADGQIVTVEFDGQVEYDDQGEFVRTHCQFKDIEERIERVRTIERLSEYRRVVSAVDRTLVRVEDVQEMLQRTTDIISQSTLFECTFLALTDDRNVEFVCQSGSELDQSDVEEFHTEQYLSSVAEAGTLPIEDVTEPPHAQHVKDRLSHPGMGVSIAAGDSQYGVLTVHFGPGESPAETEVDLLEQLANDIGIFLRNRDLESQRRTRQRLLEKRERLFRELHTTTRECLSADSEVAVFETVVSNVAESLDCSRVGLFAFDTEGGGLVLKHATDDFPGTAEDVALSPGQETAWQIFEDGRTRFVDTAELENALETVTISGEESYLGVAIGDYGLLLADCGHPTSEDIDVEMMELCSANAEAILGRMRRETELSEAAAEAAEQESRVERFRDLIDSMGRIQAAITQTETPAEMESAVCDELVSTKLVDFAWMGRPETTDTDLKRTAWAGENKGYLEVIDLASTDEMTPAQTAAANRSIVSIPAITRNVHEGVWARAALSRDYSAAVSVPIEDDSGVLYGVLTAFSTRESGFDETQTRLLGDVASLLAAYHQIHNVRAIVTESETVEVEFSIADPAYRLFALAKETDSVLEFQTLLTAREDMVRMLVSVESGSTERISERAKTMDGIRSAKGFRSPQTGRLLLEVERPCLATEVTKNGAQLTESVADRTDATVHIRYPANVPVRPLFERLKSRYSDIELVAKREQPETAQSSSNHQAGLTDRQLEIVKAAYFGGYFEVPRAISGEDLAESFGISNSAVSKHLRAAQRSLLGSLLDSTADN